MFSEKRLSSCFDLIFDGLKLKLDLICLIFTSSDITVIMWVWLVVITVRGGCVCVGGWVVGGGVRRYFQHNRGGLELIFFVLEGGTVYVFAR